MPRGRQRVRYGRRMDGSKRAGRWAITATSSVVATRTQSFNTLNATRPAGLLLSNRWARTLVGAAANAGGLTVARLYEGQMEISETARTPPSLSRRLVIVADNSLIVQAIATGLRATGEFSLVGHAHERRTSARAIAGARPEVVLIDDMDCSERAIELTREIKAEDESIAVIALSVEMNPLWLERIFDAGAIGAISKATQPDALATLIRETVSGRICRPVSNPRDIQVQDVVASEQLPLTTRELEILRLVAAGSTNGDVARHLWITEQTVKFHLRNIYRKLGFANRTEASHFAHVHGLVTAGLERVVATKRELRAAS